MPGVQAREKGKGSMRGSFHSVVPGDARRVIWRGQARARHGQAACGRAISAQRRHCPRGGAAKGRRTTRSSCCESRVTDTVFSSLLSPSLIFPDPRLRSMYFSSGQTQCSFPHLLVTCLLQPMSDKHPLQPTPFCSFRALWLTCAFLSPQPLCRFLHYTSF